MPVAIVQSKLVISVTLSLDSVPSSGQIIVVAAASIRTPPRNVISVSGYGATFTKVFGTTGDRSSFWIGTATGASNAIQVDYDGAHLGQFVAAWVLTGLTSTSVTGAQASASSTGLTGPSLTAGAGQAALALNINLNPAHTLTFPSATAPGTGWTSATLAGASDSSGGRAERVPTSSASHQVDASRTVSGAMWTQMIVIGSSDTNIAAPAATATAQAHTPTVSGTTSVDAPAATATARAWPPTLGPDVTESIPDAKHLRAQIQPGPAGRITPHDFRGSIKPGPRAEIR